MKLSSIILSIVALPLIASVDRTAAQYCLEHNPLNMHDKSTVPCPTVYETSPKQKRQDYSIPTSGGASSSSSGGTSSSSSANASPNDMFQITFTCGISDTTLCSKVKQCFVEAGQIITSTLLLNRPITVNATLLNFCTSMGDCGSPEGFLTLGGASPARTLPMQDLDGKQRFYPQALVKQFNFSSHPQFGPFDIVAMFNSVPNFYFASDGKPIAPDQSDFLFVVLHELIHGLGFTSSWDDYIDNTPQAITPDLGQGVVNGKAEFQFVEYAFDQYMVVIPQNKNATQFATQINQYATGAGASSTDINEFALNFLKSPQYSVAQEMFGFATKRNSFGFMPANVSKAGNSVILETSLVPYQPGSSVSHVDYNTYTNTSDFLMRYLQDRGVSLDQAILNGGNYSGGAIGPKLKSVLETMGYATQANPNPYRPLEGSVTNVSSSASSMISSFQLKHGFLIGIALTVTWLISCGSIL